MKINKQFLTEYIPLVWYFYVKEPCKHIKSIIWNRGIKLFWNRLWIRENEFHKSLNTDIYALMYMNSKQRDKYYTKLAKRRDIAHKQDMERDDKKYFGEIDD